MIDHHISLQHNFSFQSIYIPHLTQSIKLLFPFMGQNLFLITWEANGRAAEGVWQGRGGIVRETPNPLGK